MKTQEWNCIVCGRAKHGGPCGLNQESIPPSFHSFISVRMTQTKKVIWGILLGITFGLILLLALAALALISK